MAVELWAMRLERPLTAEETAVLTALLPSGRRVRLERIRDACHTELEPEEFDENGDGMTLTCIGFRPLPDEIAHQISHKFHLY